MGMGGRMRPEPPPLPPPPAAGDAILAGWGRAASAADVLIRLPLLTFAVTFPVVIPCNACRVCWWRSCNATCLLTLAMLLTEAPIELMQSVVSSDA